MIYKGYEFQENDGCLIIKNVKDFNPTHIFDCGQCFRWGKKEYGVYFGIVKDKCVEVSFKSTKNENEGDVIISNSGLDDAKFWYNYFDLETDYSLIKNILKKDNILAKAIEYAPGIRILKQDFNEMLISFIISANNSIPRIMKIIENICNKYGDELTYKGKVYFTFPSIEILAKLTSEDLRFSSAGFRCHYIVHTAKLAEECRLSGDDLMKISYAQALEVMQQFRGVGPKVADCVLLFSGVKMEAFPVDVWVKRVIEALYLKKSATFKEITMFADVKFGLLAGYAQQYLFYFARENKIGIKKQKQT